MKGKLFKKLTAGALALLMVGTALPTGTPFEEFFSGSVMTVSAEPEDSDIEGQGSCGDNATWTLYKDGKLVISGSDTVENKDDWTNVGDWDTFKEKITSVVIEDGIEDISGGLFNQCNNLRSAVIPGTVLWVPSDLFKYCENLSSVTLKEGVPQINHSAFEGCKNLRHITIPNTVKSIQQHAFTSSGIKEITIPSSVHQLCEQAFDSCPDLEKVTILADNEDEKYELSYGHLLFNGCEKLTDFTIMADPAKLKYTGDLYLENHYLAKEGVISTVKVPAKYLEAYKEMFDPANNTENYLYVDFNRISYGLTVIPSENGVFRAGTQKDVDAMKSTPAIKEGDTVCLAIDLNDGGVFSGFEVTAADGQKIKLDSNGTSATFIMPDCDVAVAALPAVPHGKCGDSAWWYLTDTDNDTHYDKLPITGSGAMYNYEYNYNYAPWTNYAEAITSVEIGKGITTIGELVFFDCSALSAVTIPESVTSIGSDAFHECTSMTDVYCYAYPDINWADDNCDDFKKNKDTVCHVRPEYLSTYKAKYSTGNRDTDINVTFEGDLVDMGLGEHLYGHSLSLDGDIGVNFYMELADQIKNSETAEMIFTIPNGSNTETQKLSVKTVTSDEKNAKVIGGKTYYKFKCNVSAKDMSSEIIAQLVDGDRKGNEYTYSVREYAEYVLDPAHGYDDKIVALVKAMIDYGTAAQIYFNNDASGLSVSDAVNEVTAGTLSYYKFNAETDQNFPDDVHFKGATLSLRSETTLSLYFTSTRPLTTSMSVHDATGKKLTVETENSGNTYVFRIKGISAPRLGDKIKLYFAIPVDQYVSQSCSLTYSPMTYCYNVIKGEYGEELQNVCKTLYLYFMAAQDYFG